MIARFRPAVAAVAAVAVIAAALLLVSRRMRRDYVQCAAGFLATGPRCLAPPNACPAPLVATSRGCDAPLVRIPVPATELLLGPSDWEAEGRVAPRTIRVKPFAIDAFEVTVGAFDTSATVDLARAASGVTRDDAARVCSARGGRLPTDDEWLAAAAGSSAWRYPWGQTGAVCRRAVWGIATGPCATGATGPDTVGTHPEGDSPSGAHDFAGNVAEWVATRDGVGAVRGGSWKSPLAADLRTWSKADVDPKAHDDGVGFRCAYDEP